MKKEKTTTTARGIGQYWPLMQELVVRDLKIKYRRSFLGYLWSLLNPLMMMAIMSVIFSVAFKSNVEHYPLYLICGQTMWAFFAESTNFAMHSVLGNGTLIRKVYIPKYIFPISRVLSSFVTMSFSLVAIFVAVLITGVPLSWSMLLTPVPLALLLIFCMGVGMALSAMAVYFRDILHLYSVLIMAWMYATPVFYPMEALPENIQFVLKFNPLYHYITFLRSVVLNGQIPTSTVWLGCILSSVGAFGLGLLIFRKLQKNFILHV